MDGYSPPFHLLYADKVFDVMENLESASERDLDEEPPFKRRKGLDSRQRFLEKIWR
jgi:hypothetical protein